MVKEARNTEKVEDDAATRRWARCGVGALLLAATVVGPTAGQHGVLRGRVVNIVGFDPLPLVQVSLEGTAYRALTDSAGLYVLAGFPPGEYRVHVRRIGFDPVLSPPLEWAAGETQQMDFALEASAISLDVIEVTGAARDTREVTRASTVLREEDLTDQGDILGALQGRIPGLRLSGRADDTRVRLRGGAAEPMFVINGVVATPPLRFYIGASEVKCVEVRRGRQAAMEFRSSNKLSQYNGVILIWTKDSSLKMRGACAEGQ